MPTYTDIEAIVIDSTTDPMTLYDEFRRILTRDCVEGGAADPVGPTNDESNKSFLLAARRLAAAGAYAVAEGLLLEAWNLYGHRQLDVKDRVYRASISFGISNLRLSKGDQEEALRWALLTHADDVLGGNFSGAARGVLRTFFGISEEALLVLERIAAEALTEVKAITPHAWDTAAGFAEEVLRRFSAEEEHGIATIAKTASEREFPISTAFLKVQMERMRSVPAASTNAKGDALENIAFYLLSLLPGCVPWPKILHKDQIFETDLVVRNLSPRSHLAAEILGRRFLVECKNWATPMNVSSVGYFLFRMRLTHASFGVIFSQNDITGASTGIAAGDLLDRAFHEDQSVCVVVTGTELEQMEAGKMTSFWWMLQHKIDLFRFGRQK